MFGTRYTRCRRALVASLAVAAAVPQSASAAADQPNWRYLTSHPPLGGGSTDRRIIGCFPGGSVPATPCVRDERSSAAAAPAPWDVNTPTPPASPSATFTTNGNNADVALSSQSPFTPETSSEVRPVSSTRDYLAPFTNAWRNSSCNPSNFAGGIVTPTSGDVSGGTNGNDVNAAAINLFATINRLHDWSYNLGFTETAFNLQRGNFGKGGTAADPMLGDAQAGALTGYPTPTGRDLADQAANRSASAHQDGTSPLLTAYLWQPIGGAYYPQCVDGDFDASLIAHDYGHAISDRMVAGAADGLAGSSDSQALALGEGFGDLMAVEYLAEYGHAPADDEDPFTLGAYVAGRGDRGVRNYSMANSPLNYSNVQGWDGNGGNGPHDDGEIWSAVNHDIRQAMVARYDGSYAASDAALQRECADGKKATTQCPGNRRWMQLVFDAYLLMPARATMIDARNAYMAADLARFGGEHQADMWDAFARRGLGEHASSTDPDGGGPLTATDDPQPVPSYESPFRTDEGTLAFNPRAADEPGRPQANAQLFIGAYEAGSTPVADTDPATALGATVNLVPGRYPVTVRGALTGTQRFTVDVAPGAGTSLDPALPTNRASSAAGATTSGDGSAEERAELVDGTEATSWTSAGADGTVAGRSVSVRLAGGRQIVEAVNVSAMLRGDDDGDEQDGPGNENRLTALRQFEIQACSAGCEEAGGYTAIYTSPADAFPGARPRPATPDLVLRTFDVPDTEATHLRLVVVSNQCTGVTAFITETELDPARASSCASDDAPVARLDRTVRIAELQVFSRAIAVPGTGADNGPGTPAGPFVPGPKPGNCANVATGTRGNDLLRGTSAGDLLSGGGGHDSIAGLLGNDCLNGQGGNDRLSGGGGNDRLNGGTGKDAGSGGAGSDRLTGGSGNDRLNGAAGNDSITGGTGDDRLSGGAGRDSITGGRGRDSINAGPGNDRVNSVDGRAETVDCGKGRDVVRADRRDRLKGCERKRRV